MSMGVFLANGFTTNADTNPLSRKIKNKQFLKAGKIYLEVYNI